MLSEASFQLLLFSSVLLTSAGSPLSFVAGDNFPIIHGELLANISRELQKELQGELMRTTTAAEVQPIDGEVEGREAAIQRGRAVIEEFRRSFKEAQATTESASNFVIDSLIDFPAPNDDLPTTKSHGALLDSGDEEEVSAKDRTIDKISANSTTDSSDEMPLPPQFPIFSNGKLNLAEAVEKSTDSETTTPNTPTTLAEATTPKSRRRVPSAAAFKGDQDLSAEPNDPKPSEMVSDESSLPEELNSEAETKTQPKASIRTLIDADSSTPTAIPSARPLVQLLPSQPFGFPHNATRPLRPIAWQQCSDTAADCIERADLCEHPEYRNLMWRMCPATCDACFRTPEGPACADASPLCGKKAKYCGISYFRGIMHRVCPKTCKTC